MKTKLLLILLTSLLPTTYAGANIITNGSFEDGLTGWATSLKNGVSGDFTVLTNDRQEGMNSLEVNVTSVVGQSGSVVLNQNNITVQSGNIYMLQFYALADAQGALLTVNIAGQQTNISREFKIWDRINPDAKEWQMYYFLFKPSDNSVNIEITFDQQTRYLVDNFILFDDNENEYDLAMQYMWQNNRKGYGWMASDNDVSIPLPDGRTAWIFSDTFMGTPDTTKNYLTEGTMINNLIVVQEGDNHDELRSIYAGDQSSPKALFYPESEGRVYWITDGIVEGGKLKILLGEWTILDFAGKVGVGVVNLPDLTVEEVTKPSYEGNLIPNTILEDDDFNYIYLEGRPDGLTRFTSVARIPKGELSNPSIKWEFFSQNNSWVTDYNQAKKIVDAAAGSVMKLGPNNYVMSGVPHLKNELAVWYAPTPTGPWGEKIIVHHIPAEEEVLSYLGHIHAGTERDFGVFTMSYSVYPFGGYVAQQMADKGTYLPVYIEANLRELSPYTNIDCAGIKDGSAYIDECDQCVGGTTELEPCNNITGLHYSVGEETATVFPNPFTKQVEIQTKHLNISLVRILDLTGKLIYEQSVNQTNYVSMDGNQLPHKGIYLMQIFNEHQLVEVLKIIKQ